MRNLYKCLLPVGLMLFFIHSLSYATIRYVSKTGSSTPPYTTWETASDSIQKAINVSLAGDTVIVANGVYKERLLIVRDLVLLGSGMDSCIIDGRGLVGTGVDSLHTIPVYARFVIRNFHIYGYGIGSVVVYPRDESPGIIISNCFIENGSAAIAMITGIHRAYNNIIRNVDNGIIATDYQLGNYYNINNNVILISKFQGSGIYGSWYGNYEITNNIILNTNHALNGLPYYGITLDEPERAVIRNNLVAGFEDWQYGQDPGTRDTVFIINNVFAYTKPHSSFSALRLRSGEKKVVKNNIITHSNVGIYSPAPLTASYNLYYNVNSKYAGGVQGGAGEIEADPMVMKDTLPTASLKIDYHLQAFSPAIDAGDPEILDVDGSRSDIGMYGGPLGESYKYIDLAPRRPIGIIISKDSNNVTLRWRKNSEADFSNYKIYRDTVKNFTMSSSTFLTTLTDTAFTEPIPAGAQKIYYKVTAVDSQENESEPGDEVGLILVSAEGEWIISDDYRLYQNYPNPFNPSTTISYRLKERGYVKIMVYNINGERTQILVNETKEAGYYETEFNGEGLSSGIYLYRIEVIGENKIPKHSDMKKMILIK